MHAKPIVWASVLAGAIAGLTGCGTTTQSLPVDAPEAGLTMEHLEGSWVPARINRAASQPAGGSEAPGSLQFYRANNGTVRWGGYDGCNWSAGTARIGTGTLDIERDSATVFSCSAAEVQLPTGVTTTQLESTELRINDSANGQWAYERSSLAQARNGLDVVVPSGLSGTSVSAAACEKELPRQVVAPTSLDELAVNRALICGKSATVLTTDDPRLYLAAHALAGPPRAAITSTSSAACDKSPRVPVVYFWTDRGPQLISLDGTCARPGGARFLRSLTG